MVDGYISGAEVCIDENNSWTCDSNENTTTSDNDGEFTIKRVNVSDKELYLMPENESFPPIKITEEMDFQVWGVVTYIIHKAL